MAQLRRCRAANVPRAALRVQRLKVLFVSHLADDAVSLAADISTRRRCLDLAHALRRLGHEARCVGQRDFERSFTRLPSFDVYVFHRPTLTEAFSRIFSDLEPNARRIVDLDGLSFDVRNFVKARRQPPASQELERIARCGEAVGLFTHATVADESALNAAKDVSESVQPVLLPDERDLDGRAAAVALEARATRWLDLVRTL